MTSLMARPSHSQDQHSGPRLTESGLASLPPGPGPPTPPPPHSPLLGPGVWPGAPLAGQVTSCPCLPGQRWPEWWGLSCPGLAVTAGPQLTAAGRWPGKAGSWGVLLAREEAGREDDILTGGCTVGASQWRLKCGGCTVEAAQWRPHSLGARAAPWGLNCTAPGTRSKVCQTTRRPIFIECQHI